MRKKRKHIGTLIQGLLLESAGAEGNCIGHLDERVVFVSKGVPGDVVNAKIVKQKSRFFEAKIEEVVKPSDERVVPPCKHANYCGGCKWQQMSYKAQLFWKEKQVKDALERIGRLTEVKFLPIQGAPKNNGYRNKIEYSFTNYGWEETMLLDMVRKPALGYHIPGRFDQIFQVNECLLQPLLGNEIRNALFEYSLNHKLVFYDPKNQHGFMRNLMLRNNQAGQWMVVVVFGEKKDSEILGVMNFLKEQFPQIYSLQYMINEKVNDFLGDLEAVCFSGSPWINETLCEYQFRIAPQSFFQVNVPQAEALYCEAVSWAELTGKEIVYDLYSGTGTISLVLAQSSKKVIGVEYVQEAILDAKQNAIRNGVTNADFVCGDLGKMFDETFIKKHGHPDVVMIDPPRAGMHPDVVNTLNKLQTKKIVYISCNPATQARDLQLLNEVYEVVQSKAFDMFPNTHHVENVVLLKLRN